MAKTRLTNEKRNIIVSYMASRHAAKEGRSTLDQTYERLVALANAIIREKYPENDMLVFRKYPGASRVDYCLNFNNNDTGRYVRIQFDRDTGTLADLPCTRGCHSNDTFAATAELIDTYEQWQSLQTAITTDRDDKLAEYRAFVIACKTVEDVEEVVPLPSDLRMKLTGSNTALVAISDEVVAGLRAEFADAA